jgi:N-glycosylase/DNA lyase
LRNLQHHRREVVAREQRAALVALAFVRGVPYAAVERNPRCNRRPFDRPGPDWSRVAKLVGRYGRTNIAEKPLWEAIVAWRSGIPCETKEQPAPAEQALAGVGAVLRRAVRIVRIVRRVGVTA